MASPRVFHALLTHLSISASIRPCMCDYRLTLGGRRLTWLPEILTGNRPTTVASWGDLASQSLDKTVETTCSAVSILVLKHRSDQQSLIVGYMGLHVGL